MLIVFFLPVPVFLLVSGRMKLSLAAFGKVSNAGLCSSDVVCDALLVCMQPSQTIDQI